MTDERKNNLIALTTEEIRNNLEIIIKQNIPIRRMKKDGEYSFIPPKDFDLFLKDAEMVFYLDHEYLEKIQNEKGITINESAIPVINNFIVNEESIDSEFQNRLDQAMNMSISERIQLMLNNNYKLKKFAEDGRRFDSQVINETGLIFTDALCINKTTYMENLANPLPAPDLTRIAKESFELIDGLLNMVSRGKASFYDLARVEHIQTGSRTLNHMNRILFRFISFMFYYNNYFQKQSLEIQKFRSQFKEKYFPYYDKLMKGSQNINLEIVFKNGITPIKEKAIFLDYTMSGLMHDIGKLPEITYHDSSAAFDITKARRHVFDSYNMLVESKQFSSAVISTALLHHEYYGASFGYRQTSTFIKKFTDRRDKSREISPTKFFISYNVLDVAYGNSLSFFPNKVLEIIDVFDSMTDPDKKYKKAMTAEEALKAIRLEYVEKNELGIDPIIFNIFSDFLKTSGIIVDPSFIETIKI